MSAPLTAARAAEAQLLTALASAATALDAVGTDSLDDALARLEQAADGARARLAGAMYKMNAVVGGVTAALARFAAGVEEDLAGATASLGTAGSVTAEPALLAHAANPAVAAPDDGVIELGDLSPEPPAKREEVAQSEAEQPEIRLAGRPEGGGVGDNTTIATANVPMEEGGGRKAAEKPPKPAKRRRA